MLETQKEPSLQVEIMFGNGLRPQIWQQFVSRYLHKKTALVACWQGLGSAFIADPDLTDFLDADPDPA